MNEVTNCRWCGKDHGLQCPTVKAIEYFEDGKTIKRMEFFPVRDQVVAPRPNPAGIPTYWPTMPRDPFRWPPNNQTTITD